MKSLLRTIAAFTVGFLILYVLPNYMSFNDLKPLIEHSFLEATGKSIKIEGDIKLEIVPKARVSLINTSIVIDNEKSLDIPKLVLDTGIGILFSKTPSINGITIVGAKIDASLFKSALENPAIDKKSSIKEFGLENVDLILTTYSSMFDRLSNTSGTVSFEHDNYIYAQGSFKSHGITYHLDAKLNNDKKESTISLETDFGSFEFTGNALWSTGKSATGNILLEFKENKNPELDKLQIFKILANDRLTIKSKLHIDEKFFSLNDIIITTKSISKGAGNLKYEHGGELSTAFNIDAINLDQMLGQSKADKAYAGKIELLKEFLTGFKFDIPHTLFGSLEIKINEILASGKAISNVNLYIDIFEGRFILSQSKLDLPGKASLSIDGTLSHNDIRPKFDGHLVLDAPEFSEFAEWLDLDKSIIKNFHDNKLHLKTAISVIPRSVRFDNIFLELGDLKSIGSFSIRHYGEPRLHIKSNMRFNSVNLDTFAADKSFDDFIGSLYAYDYDRSGNKFSEITKDFSWLRQFGYNLSMDWLFDRVVFKNAEYNQLNIAGRIIPNSFVIEHFALNSEHVTMNADAEFSTIDIAPKLRTNLNFDYLHDTFIQQIWPTHEYLEDRKNKVYSELTSLGDIKADAINYYNLDSINGELNLNINDYVSKNLTYQNLALSAALNDGIINIASLSADIFSGKLKAVGNIVINTLITNCVATYTFNSFNSQEMLQYLNNFSQLDGYFSASGSISSKGATVADLYSNLSGSHSFIGRNVTLSNLDIGEIVKAVEGKRPLADKLKILNQYLTQGASVFDDVKGSLIIDRGSGLFKDVFFSNSRVSGAYSAKIDFNTNLIGSLARISFIPLGKASTLSLDFASNGPLNKLQTTINLDQINQYLLQEAQASRQNIEDENVRKLLRNKVTTVSGEGAGNS